MFIYLLTVLNTEHFVPLMQLNHKIFRKIFRILLMLNYAKSIHSSAPSNTTQLVEKVEVLHNFLTEHHPGYHDCATYC